MILRIEKMNWSLIAFVYLIVLLGVDHIHGDLSANEPTQNTPQLIAVDFAKATDAPRQPEYAHQLVVKFRDELKVRANDGNVSAQKAEVKIFTNELSRLQRLQFKQLVQVPQERILQLEEKAFKKSGRRQSDLLSMMVVDAPKGELQQIANALHDSEFVEWVEFEMLNPPPPLSLIHI